MIRDAAPADYPAILAINLESEHVLAPLDRPQLARLHAMADRLRVVDVDGQVAAFLIVLREGASYESPNYRYFAARLDRFLYVDRIVVAVEHQGQGWGGALYRELFAYARQERVPRVTCEVDVVPPNEGSHLFHAQFGFRELGRQWVADGRKQVSLQEAAVPIDPSTERFIHPITVTAADIDELEHVNNVVYLRWVQDVATAHWQAAATPEQQAAVAWVVVRHEIDYKHPGVLGDELLGRTWVGSAVARAFERHTEIVRARDGRVLARARTLWCPISRTTGKVITVGSDVRERFSVPAHP